MADAGSVINPYGVGLDVSDKTLDELFPTVDPEFAPFGHRVLVQIRRVINKTSSGIILAKESKETEAYNNTIAKVIAVGPLAFKKRTTGEEWPEGIWSRVGEYVRVPRYGGDRWVYDPDDGLEPIHIVLFSDADLLGRYTGDVTKVRSHLT